MARIICSICGDEVKSNRTSHLKREHGIAPYKGVVRDHFLHPWEVEEK